MNKEIMIAAGFSEQVRAFERGNCTTCGASIGVHPNNPRENRYPLALAGQNGHGPFKDALSEREYRISGMCQECQDKTFAPPPPSPCDDCNKETTTCPHKDECPV